MAMKITREKVRWTRSTLTVPYHITSDDDTALDAAVAQQTVLAQALSDQGSPATDFDGNQLSYKSYRFLVNYDVGSDGDVLPEPDQPPATDAGTLRIRFQARAKPKHLMFIPFEDRLKTYPDLGQNSPDMDGHLNVQFDGEKHVVLGATIQPPAPTFVLQVTATNALITDSFVRTLIEQAEAGAVHKNDDGDKFMGYDPGSVMLVSAVGGITAINRWSIDLGFATAQNVTGKKIGPFEVDHGGFNLVTTYARDKEQTVDGLKVFVPRIKYVWVDRVWPEFDLNTIGLSGDLPNGAT